MTKNIAMQTIEFWKKRLFTNMNVKYVNMNEMLKILLRFPSHNHVTCEL